MTDPIRIYNGPLATNVVRVGSYPNFFHEIIDKTQPVLFYIVAAYYQSGSSGGATLQYTASIKAYDPVNYSFFFSRSIVSPPDWVRFEQVTDPLATNPATVVQYFADNGFSPVVVSSIPQTQLSNQGFRFDIEFETTHDSGFMSTFYLRHPPDDIPPTVIITPPTGIVTVGGINYSKNNPEIISISAVDNSGGTGVKHITPTLDGTAMSAVSGSSTNVSVTGEGSHTISATAEDNAGNISSPVSYTFFIDSIDPTGDVTLSSAQDIFDVGGLEYVNVSSPELEFTFADSGSGLDEIEINLNGSAYATYTGLSSPYTESISSAVEGQNTIEYIIKDVAGNELTINYEFYVDTTAPDGYIVISTQDTIRENSSVLYTKETDVNVDLHFGDSGTDPSGISYGLIKLNDSSTPTVADFSSGIDLSSETHPKTDHNVTGLIAGQLNDLTFFTIDNVENISTGNTVSVYVDQTDPTGSIDISSSQDVHVYSGDGITYSNTVNILLELAHSDSESGLF